MEPDVPFTFDLDAARSHTLTSIAELESRFGHPRQTSIDKESVAMTALEQEFVRASPFYLLATANADGSCDVSPRGDPAGAAQVVDERTLILPDRVGNKRTDSLRNLIENQQVGLLFLVPGANETLRINGRAVISTHQPLLEALAARGRPAELALIVETEAVYMHCARAFRRSGLWDPATWPDLGTVPQMPAIFKQKMALEGSIAEIAAQREQRYRTEPI